jgi:phosphatidylglycerol:prolipoprotein diacylglycerol transferase
MRSKKAKTLLLSHYLLGYGMIRLIIEALRGDEIRGLWGPLTPSQWISVTLIVTGIFLLKINKFKKLKQAN